MARAASLVFVLVVVACSSSTSSSSSGGGDGGSGAATSCVTIDPATYDATCTADTDCMLVPTGQLCTGGCDCGATALAAKERARYDAAVSPVKLLACPCAYPGAPRCVQGTCKLCPPGPNAEGGCPDAG